MEKFKVVIAGGRTFDNYKLLERVCDHLLSRRKNIEIVSGTARGADRLGEQYAKSRGYSIKRFPADWDAWGKSAGYRRNAQMAKYADAAIVFWDGQSKGTAHMINLAKEEGIHVSVNKY